MNNGLLGLMLILFLAIVSSISFAALGTPTITMSNTFIDQGQTIVFTANQFGGVGVSPYSYAYNVYAFNTQTSTTQLIANQLYTGLTTTSNTFKFTPSSLYVGNNLFKANVVVVDSTTLASNSVSNSFGYNSIPSVSSFFPSNTLLDSGQYLSWTVVESGGTGSFAAQLMNSTSSPTPQGSNIVVTKGGSNKFPAFVVTSPTQGNSFDYNTIVTDSGTTSPFVFNSIFTDAVTVNAFPFTTIGRCSLQVDNGNTCELTVLPTSGTFPQTCQFYNVTSSTTAWKSPVIVFNTLVFNDIIFTVSTPTNGNVFSYNTVCTDGATTPVVTNSVTVSFVANVLPIVSITSSPLTGNVGTSSQIVYTANVIGGSPPMTYNFLVLNSVTGTIIANQLYTSVSSLSNSFTFSTNSQIVGNTISANVLVTDVQNYNGVSGSSNPLLVGSQAATLTLSNTFIDQGQTIAFTGSITGATGPYTYNFSVVNQNSLNPIEPSIMVYVPTYIGGSSGTLAGFSTLLSNPNSVYLKETDIFVALINPTGSVTLGTSGLSDVNINSVITASVANNIVPVLVIGGATESPAVINEICSTPAFQTGVIANVVNVIKGVGSGTLPYNGVAVDFETPFNCGGGGNSKGTAGNGQLTTFFKNLNSNVMAINSMYTMDAYVALYENQSFNYPAISPYVNYFDVAVNTGVGQLTAMANLVGGKPRVRDGFDLAGDQQPFSFYLAAVSNDIRAGFGIGIFNTYFTQGANAVIINAIASNITQSHLIVANALYTNVAGTSKVFAWSPPNALYTSNSFEANVTITDTFGDTFSSGYTDIGYNSFPQINLVPVNTILDSGQYVVYNLNEIGGTGYFLPGGALPYQFVIAFSNATSNARIPGVWSGGSTGLEALLSKGTSNTIHFPVFTSTNGKSLGYFSYLLEQGTTTEIQNYSPTNIITLNTALASPTISIQHPSSLTTNIVAISITGSSPYTYNFIVYNAVTNTFFANQLGTSNVFPLTTNAYMQGNSFYVNVIVTDSATVPETANSINSYFSFVALNSVTLDPTSAVISALQSISFVGNWSGGTGPYTATLKSFASANCIVGGATFQTISGISTNGTVFNPVAPLTTTFYCLFVTGSTGNTINSTPSEIQISGIVPVNTTVGNIPLTRAIALCTLNTGPPNSVSCSGNDILNVINTWVVTISNSSGFAGAHIINTTTLFGNSFIYSNSPIYPSNPTTWLVTASGPNTGYLSWQGTFATNTHTSGFYTPLDTLLTVIFLLIGVVAGSATTQQHKLSSTLFIEGLMLAFLYMVGLTQWLGIAVTGALILFCVIIGVLGYTQENKSITGY